jgi:hypothetical protein
MRARRADAPLGMRVVAWNGGPRNLSCHDRFCARRGSKSDTGDAHSLILSAQHSGEAQLSCGRIYCTQGWLRRIGIFIVLTGRIGKSHTIGMGENGAEDDAECHSEPGWHTSTPLNKHPPIFHGNKLESPRSFSSRSQDPELRTSTSSFNPSYEPYGKRR